MARKGIQAGDGRKDVVENDVKMVGLEKGMVSNKETWRRQIHGP